MGYPLKQNQTAQPLLFFMVSSTDHLTGKTAASPTVTLSKNGGAFAAPSGAVSEIGNGWYQVAGNATDSNTLGPLALHATGTGADPTDDLFPVVAYDPQAGANLGLTDLDAAVSSRMATFTLPTNFSALAITAGGAVTVGTNNDKTGYSLAVTPPTAAQVATAVWQDATPADFTVASSIGKSLYTSGNAPGAQNGFLILGTNTGPMTLTTSQTGVFALTISHTGATSGGGVSITAAGGSPAIFVQNSGTGDGAVFTGGTGGVDLRANITGNLTGNVSGSVNSVTADVGVTQAGADKVWDTVLASHLTAGSTGHALNAAGSAGDPWATALPGAYTAGTAGFIVGTNLDALVSSRLATSSYTAAPTAVQNADALLGRSLATGANGGRTVQDALRFLRNKWSISGTTLTVCQEDDVTTAWTAVVTATAGANPVTGNDPA